MDRLPFSAALTAPSNRIRDGGASFEEEEVASSYAHTSSVPSTLMNSRDKAQGTVAWRRASIGPTAEGSPPQAPAAYSSGPPSSSAQLAASCPLANATLAREQSMLAASSSSQVNARSCGSSTGAARITCSSPTTAPEVVRNGTTITALVRNRRFASADASKRASDCASAMDATGTTPLATSASSAAEGGGGSMDATPSSGDGWYPNLGRTMGPPSDSERGTTP
mmetsp:Transcript_24415/g.43473  ORF Transcript_24415/g.43473 Transcript_24415/m.43473 type:complete len:224 (-) Transcript_24415:261-932(-)